MEDPVLKDIDIPVLNFVAESVNYFLDKKTFPNRVISTNGIMAKHKDESDLETTTFRRLKTSEKDSPKGFFGYLEEESLKIWEVVSKKYNVDTAIDLKKQLENKEEFCKLRGINLQGEDKDILTFYGALLDKFKKILDLLPEELLKKENLLV